MSKFSQKNKLQKEIIKWQSSFVFPLNLLYIHSLFLCLSKSGGIAFHESSGYYFLFAPYETD